MQTNSDEFQREDTPPDMGAVLHIIRVGAHDRHSLVILSDALVGVWTHYSLKRKRTIRCRGVDNDCEGCVDEMRRIWSGYLHVAKLTTGQQGILELTALAGNRLIDVMGGIESLRGQRIFCYRERGNIKSPIAVESNGPTEPTFFLPPKKDVFPTLRRLWGMRG